jgi:hypothetical protein
MIDLTSTVPGLIVLVVLIVLSIAAILMPLYVIHMSGQVDRMRKTLDRLLWQAEQQAKREEERDARRY